MYKIEYHPKTTRNATTTASSVTALGCLLLWFGGGCDYFPITLTAAAAFTCCVRDYHCCTSLPIRRNIPTTITSKRQCTTSTSHLHLFNNLLGHPTPPTPTPEEKNINSNKGTPTPTSPNSSSRNKKERYAADDNFDTDNNTPDFVERIFGMLFGEKEEAPWGLKRFGPERFPEQYPATVTEWADPVASDDPDMATLRPLLKNTHLETRRLTLSYSANVHDWRPDAFHARVDKKGPSLVVCTVASPGGQVVGGYNPKGWVSYGEARGSVAAFLFASTGSRRSSRDSRWIKLRKVGGPSLAQLDYPESGPSFGADALVIPLDANQPKRARSKLGSYYEKFKDGTNTLFAVVNAYHHAPSKSSSSSSSSSSSTSSRSSSSSSVVELKDLKVYQGVYEPDEFIPHTDAEPFALY